MTDTKPAKVWTNTGSMSHLGEFVDGKLSEKTACGHVAAYGSSIDITDEVECHRCFRIQKRQAKS